MGIKYFDVKTCGWLGRMSTGLFPRRNVNSFSVIRIKYKIPLFTEPAWIPCTRDNSCDISMSIKLFVFASILVFVLEIVIKGDLVCKSDML